MSVTAKQRLNELEVLLRAEKDLGDKVRADLYSHITDVMSRILQYHSNDAYDKFEDISNMVKLSNLRNIDPKDDSEINDKSKVSNQEMLDMIKKFKSFVGDEEVTKAHKFYMPNLQEQAAMLEWAGISFGEDFTILLQKSMKKLACQSGASQMQFFGKIFGTEKDYWVVCGKLPYVEEEPSNPNQEPRGSGVNTYVYWVTDNIIGDWIQLPECQPEHLCAARQLKHVFSGNLNASIDSCPPFPGKERHLLRATLARITHGTELCFKGTYDFTEDEPPVEKFADDQPSF